MQQMQARKDADDRQRQQELAAEMQQLQQERTIPGPEADGTPRMTAAQRDANLREYLQCSKADFNVSQAQAQAEAKQMVLEREKVHQDAVNSDTVAIDFSHPSVATPGAPAQTTAVLGQREEMSPTVVAESIASNAPGAVKTEDSEQPQPVAKTDPMAPYNFDGYQGCLYRVFEGTVLEGVVTNHIDGGLTGPILIMLTTDYYSHDHQQLLMPQGTRLIGTVQGVGNAQQRKLFVTFHRAVCPGGFSLQLDKYVGLDPIGTTGLATKIDHGYLQAFAARRQLAVWVDSPRLAIVGVFYRLRHKFVTESRSSRRMRVNRFSITSSTVCQSSRSKKVLAPACTSAPTS